MGVQDAGGAALPGTSVSSASSQAPPTPGSPALDSPLYPQLLFHAVFEGFFFPRFSSLLCFQVLFSYTALKQVFYISGFTLLSHFLTPEWFFCCSGVSRGFHEELVAPGVGFDVKQKQTGQKKREISGLGEMGRREGFLESSELLLGELERSWG